MEMGNIDTKEGNFFVGKDEDMTVHERVMTSHKMEESQGSESTQRAGVADEPKAVTSAWTKNWLLVAYSS